METGSTCSGTGADGPFGAWKTLELPDGAARVVDLPALARAAGRDLGRLPYSIRILLENAARHCGLGVVEEKDVLALLEWDAAAAERPEFAFMPGRVLLQDFTGVPCVVDLAGAAVRSGAQRRRSQGDRPQRAGRPGHRSFCAGGLLRCGRCLQHQHGSGDGTQRRALCPVALGPGRVRQPARHAARDGHLSPGQPGVPGRSRETRRVSGGAGRRSRRRARRNSDRRKAARRRLGPRRVGRRRSSLGVSGHGHRHRFSHHNDQRPGRAGLGGGGHRGRGGHGRAAVFHAGAPSGGGADAGQSARWGYRHRPSAHRHGALARSGGSRPLRGVLRARSRRPQPGR